MIKSTQNYFPFFDNLLMNERKWTIAKWSFSKALLSSCVETKTSTLREKNNKLKLIVSLCHHLSPHWFKSPAGCDVGYPWHTVFMGTDDKTQTF